jgi:hypothetical protein
MGIGRREFLAQFGAAIAFLTTTSGALAAVVGDLYLNRRHGIAFRKPSGWTFQDLRDVGTSKEAMVLEFDGLTPELWVEALRSEPMFAAFVVVADMRVARTLTDEAGDIDRIAPGISVHYEGTWATDGPDPAAPFSLEAFVTRDLALFAEGYRDFRLARPPRSIELSSCAAIEYVATYRYVQVRLPHAVPMRERVVYVYQGPAIYSIRMFDYPKVAPTLGYDFDAFLSTVRVL